MRKTNIYFYHNLFGLENDFYNGDALTANKLRVYFIRRPEDRIDY